MLRFVREQQSENSFVKKVQKSSIAIENGSVSREKYENILQMPSTSNQESGATSKVRKSRRKIVQPFDKNELFKAAACNDVKTIERMNVNNRNVNVTDAFGWSALMMAACDGHLNAVKLLIRRGANIDIQNKQMDTAMCLAKKNEHQSVVAALQKMQLHTDTICLDSDDEPTTVVANNCESFFCDICQLEFTQTNRKAHEASTLHRFNRPESQKSARHFGIPESNIGFQMLLHQGWDRESGLGPERDGNIYPIKTTLRKPRSGLGTRQPNKSKVTHFKPFDCDAIKSTKPKTMEIVKTKRQLRAERRQTEHKDRHLRKILS